MSNNPLLAIVTGGSRGIGRAIVERLARGGYHVLFTYVSDIASAESVVANLRANGQSAEAFRCDIAQLADIDALFAYSDTLPSDLKVVVSNAATYAIETLETLDEVNFDRTMAINAKAPAFISKAAAQRLGSGGRLILISSIAAREASPMYISYAMSKAALGALVRASALALGPKGVTVNAIAPGLTDTDMTAILTANVPSAVIETAIDKTALKRMGQPADIAGMVAMLASADSGWTTGQIIDCSGGHSL